MTQPDYDRIADALNRALHRTPRASQFHLKEAVKMLAFVFRFTDIRFNHMRFLGACFK